MWFNNFQGMNWGLVDPTKISVNNLDPIFNLLHDSMPMEQDAQNNGDAIWKQLATCCIDKNSVLVFPLKITTSTTITPRDIAVIQSIYPGKTVKIQATVTGGSEPLGYSWSIQLPGSSGFAAIPGTEGSASGTTFNWTPKRIGAYKIKFNTWQVGSNLKAEKILSFNVIEKPLGVK
ncbi:MAG: hypothetical protein HZA17_04470 [Nitrospirae bacterium]|nr:hypothetical protein [Nitrospirota bacterium]